MVENHTTLFEYACLSLIRIETRIIRPTTIAKSFEIKPIVITMLQITTQFYGMQDEDSNLYTINFLEIYDIFKINGAFDDVIRLRLFLYS